jgi:hypothetical protein
MYGYHGVRMRLPRPSEEKKHRNRQQQSKQNDCVLVTGSPDSRTWFGYLSTTFKKEWVQDFGHFLLFWDY